MKRTAWALCILFAAACVQRAFAADKLTDDDRIELLRGLMAEYATVKAYLPRSKKPLVIDSYGKYDKTKWEEAGRELGPAARVGDLVEVTRVSIERDRIVLEINNGLKRKGHWYDHVEVGMGGTMSPVNQNPNTNAPSGTYIALVFDKDIPPIKPEDVKKILKPVLDFDKHTVTENYVETLPAPVQEAIKQKKAIEGMTRDQVLLAMGKPRRKERNTTADGTDMEDWIYGDPPGKITFVTFAGSKVAKVREDYAALGGATAPSPAPVQ